MASCMARITVVKRSKWSYALLNYHCGDSDYYRNDIIIYHILYISSYFIINIYVFILLHRRTTATMGPRGARAAIWSCSTAPTTITLATLSMVIATSVEPPTPPCPTMTHTTTQTTPCVVWVANGHSPTSRCSDLWSKNNGPVRAVIS